jgi:ABC-2 type transport system permease protein
MKLLRAQTAVELRTMLRNGEQLLLTLGIPLLLLAFFSSVDVLPTGTDDPVDFLAPGVLALAVMSTSMVSLGIATGFERSYLVLKRLGATPLGRPRLVAAKILAVMVVEVVQFCLLVPVAVAFGWRPTGANWPLAVGAVLAGTAAFAGLGLLIAGRLRGEINLAVQNGLYLMMLLLGGMVISVAELPRVLAEVAQVLPSGALAEALRQALSGGGSIPGRAWITLGAWALAAPPLAARLFRWW